MKPILQTIGAVALIMTLNACAHREYSSFRVNNDGVTNKLTVKSTTFLIMSKMERVNVTTNGMSISGYDGKTDSEALEAIFEAAFKAAKKSATGL